MTDSLTGKMVGRIQVLELIGKGGMGEVYAGFDEKLERKVALKCIRAEHRLDAESRTRFVREARILSQLQHPNICQIFDYIEGEDSDLLVLEYVRGRGLGELISSGMDSSVKLAVARELTGVLVAAHERDIIHRDLKPDNVMVGFDGQVKVLDFGLSRSLTEEETLILSDVTRANGEAEAVMDSESSEAKKSGHRPYFETVAGSIIGTLGYMSPEQACGNPVTAASDVFSLGLVLQHLFTESAPFKTGEDRFSRLKSAQEGRTKPVVGVDSDLARLIERMKSRIPATRPAAIDVLDRLDFIASKPARRRARIFSTTVVVLLLALTIGIGMQWYRAEQEGRRADQEAETARDEAAARTKALVVEQMTYRRTTKARRAVKTGQISAAVEAYLDVVEMRKKLGGFKPGGDPLRSFVLFELACVHARSGDEEAALSVLAEAVEHGFQDSWISEEPDLQALKDLPSFQALVKEVESNAKTSQESMERRMPEAMKLRMKEGVTTQVQDSATERTE